MSKETTTLARIKDAYARASIDVAREDDVRLPKWEQLPLGYRQAFITVFTAGGHSALDEFQMRTRAASNS